MMPDSVIMNAKKSNYRNVANQQTQIGMSGVYKKDDWTINSNF